MTDTPEYIKKLQLDIWLSKSPGERLRQMLIDNESLYLFWKQNNPAFSKQQLNHRQLSKQNNKQ